MSSFFHTLGGVILLAREIIRLLIKGEVERPVLLAQIWEVTRRSAATVIFAGAFVGAILVIQFGLMLGRYQANSLLGGLTASALIREVGPLIISFLLAGKIGAFTAAELSTMKVTEQIDSIRCLGTNPVAYLLAPRWCAILVSSLILLQLGLLVSVGGAIGVASLVYGVNPLQFVETIPRFTGAFTLIAGFIKSLSYSAVVASVCCYAGYTASGGARGVGRAVTQAAVLTNFYIVLVNYVLTQCLSATEHLISVWRSPL